MALLFAIAQSSLLFDFDDYVAHRSQNQNADY